ncbi:MAG: hypothetical protein U0132_03920 [Gemmatimonadaceae bacterium]
MKALVFCLAVAACSAGTAAKNGMPRMAAIPSTEGYGKEVAEGLQRVRASTARFVQLDSAVAAGYARDVHECLSAPAGGMGFHHMNRSYLDTHLEVEHPEILLFERERNGTYALNGVEYIVPYRVWPKDSIPPTIMGQSLRRADELNLWYLHMWAWKSNPNGLFANWNPKVHCEKA